MGLTQVILTVFELLKEANPDSPLNVDAAQMFRSDPALYHSCVTLWTFAFADGKLCSIY